MFPETENNEQYPIALSSFPTLETTSPVSGYSASYIQTLPPNSPVS